MAPVDFYIYVCVSVCVCTYIDLMFLQLSEVVVDQDAIPHQEVRTRYLPLSYLSQVARPLWWNLFR